MRGPEGHLTRDSLRRLHDEYRAAYSSREQRCENGLCPGVAKYLLSTLGPNQEVVRSDRAICEPCLLPTTHEGLVGRYAATELRVRLLPAEKRRPLVPGVRR